MKTLMLLPLLALLPLAASQDAQDSHETTPAPIRPVEAQDAVPERAEAGGADRAPDARTDAERRLAPRARVGARAGSGFLGVRLASRGAETTIAEVLPNTPAAEAGLQPGDRLVSVAGRPVTGADDVVADLARSAPGESVRLEILRDGRLLDVEAVLGERPGDAVEGGAPRSGGLAPRAARPFDPLQPDDPRAHEAMPPDDHGPFRIFGIGPRGGFVWPDASSFGGDDEDLRRWLDDQERRTQALREQLERQFSDLRREFDRDFGDLRRDLERNLGRGGAWLERRFGGGPLGDSAIPAEAWADLEQRLGPLEEQRRRIAREWAEAHGHPEWADAVPPFGVEVKIERREETLTR